MKTLPLPPFFKPTKVQEVFRVPYETRAKEATEWALQHGIPSASTDHVRVALLAVDVQNTFCLPDFELYVGGRSGMGAIEDNERLCRWLYGNLGFVTKVFPTMDTHTAAQIFHPIFWINDLKGHPSPSTMISLEDVEKGRWRVNPAVTASVLGSPAKYPALQTYATHYVRTLTQEGKYQLMIWPYHAMLGGTGHALVSSVEEAFFFHNIARNSQTEFQIKGGNPLTENYSVLRGEVLVDHNGNPIAQRNAELYQILLDYDVVVITGQAKSHCVAWTIQDLLDEIVTRDPALAGKVYLLENTTSAVFVPRQVTGLDHDIDFTDQANEAFARFAKAGMRIVNTTMPVQDWPGLSGLIA